MTLIDTGRAIGDDRWTLIWQDEFDGPIGSGPDAGQWVYDIGNRNGWGNNELQVYTHEPVNACIVDDPQALNGKAMAITAIQGEDGEYTSARLKTYGLHEWTYGRFEGRIKIPTGQGIWPALWLLGADHHLVRWPACGEIDIMEWIGRQPADIYGTLHGPGYSGDAGIQGGVPHAEGLPYSGEYHVFGVDWSPGSIEWFLDGVRYHVLTPADLPAGARWVFDHPFYLIVNLAVGGDWPGYPDHTTQFPQSLNIDYIRVFQANPER